MERNINYWYGKEDRAKNAQRHTEDMEDRYMEQILDSIKRTIIYKTSSEEIKKARKTGKMPKITVCPLDTVEAGFTYGNGKTAILNFASYKYPGGGFLAGSSAQEECICHMSCLYNVISVFDDTYYKYNRNNLNHGLYLNRALYSPDIIFEQKSSGKVRKFDVLTCAAPNFSTASNFAKDKKIIQKLNTKALVERIFFIRQILQINHVSTAILGAFGCGVFGQNPAEVAYIMKKAFSDTLVDSIVFAVLGENTENFKVFQKTFG